MNGERSGEKEDEAPTPPDLHLPEGASEAIEKSAAPEPPSPVHDPSLALRLCVSLGCGRAEGRLLWTVLLLALIVAALWALVAWA